MNRNIEVGCLVMVVGCKRSVRYLGKSMMVMSIVKDGYIRPDGIAAKTTVGISILCENNEDRRGFSQHNPNHLIRIDNYDASTDTVTTEQE